MAAEALEALDKEVSKMTKTEHVRTDKSKKVFIIHGRNTKVKTQIVLFLRSLGLDHLDFDDVAAAKGAAFVGNIVREGMTQAQGIVVLFTADEFASLRPEYYNPYDCSEDRQRWQARPNVIFEAGMAFGTAQERTILVVAGAKTKLFSDVNGIHLTYLCNDQDSRRQLREKLIGAGCDVDQKTTSWLDVGEAGDFDGCVLSEVSTRSPF